MIGTISAKKLRNTTLAQREYILSEFLKTDVSVTEDEWLIAIVDERDFNLKRAKEHFSHLGNLSVLASKTKCWYRIVLHERTKEIIRSDDLREQKKKHPVDHKSDAEVEL